MTHAVALVLGANFCAIEMTSTCSADAMATKVVVAAAAPGGTIGSVLQGVSITKFVNDLVIVATHLQTDPHHLSMRNGKAQVVLGLNSKSTNGERTYTDIANAPLNHGHPSGVNELPQMIVDGAITFLYDSTNTLIGLCRVLGSTCHVNDPNKVLAIERMPRAAHQVYNRAAFAARGTPFATDGTTCHSCGATSSSLRSSTANGTINVCMRC